MAEQSTIRADAGALIILIKVVPGAKRSEVAGMLADRLKVRVAAPPEDGKANKAVEALLATTLGLKPANVTVCQGHTRPEKSVRVSGISLDAAAQALGIPAS